MQALAKTDAAARSFASIAALGRWARAGLLAGTALAAPLAAHAAAPKTASIGVTLPFTGADAESATRIRDGVTLAINQANAAHAVPGYTLSEVALDNGTATAGQYDPAQAATNARNLVSNHAVLAAIGPEMSGSAKAMAPILNQGGLSMITPSATNPDLTNPNFKAQYRPEGTVTFFRTVTTDAFQGPNMANFMAKNLHVKTVYILDDSGAYGVGLADAFEAQAKKDGIQVLGRDRLDPQNADYSSVLTKIKSLNPQAVYYGGVGQAGVKLCKQSYQVIPSVIKAGGDGVYTPEMLSACGFPAAEGWYATIASPHVMDSPDAKAFAAAYEKAFNLQPDDYSITAYDGANTIIAAMKSVVQKHKALTRASVNAALRAATVKTLQGPVAFDENGDIKNRTVSVFQIRENKSKPLTNILDQYAYVGVAPQS